LIFVGHDWAEDHHDVVVLDEVGERLVSARLVDGVDGVAGFHGLVAESVDEAEEVVIGPRRIGACSSARWWRLAIRYSR
jgi:hypothetical protein